MVFGLVLGNYPSMITMQVKLNTKSSMGRSLCGRKLFGNLWIKRYETLKYHLRE